MEIDTASLLSYFASQSSPIAYPDPRGEYMAPPSSRKECKELGSIFNLLPMVSISKELSGGINEAGMWPK